ncbi:MAG: hypothetical protein Q8R92_17930 [Deltaproteobacteria bacterium]|nr:hypothetical protein [Deltaproteobacteria bacterium]
MRFSGTRFVSTRREASGRLAIVYPPARKRPGDGGWRPESRAVAIRAADLANQVLVLAQQGASGAVSSLLPSLQAELDQLPLGDGQAWGEYLLDALDAEGAISSVLTPSAPPVTGSASAGDVAVMDEETGETIVVPMEQVPSFAEEVSPGVFVIAKKKGLPWGWIAGGALVLVGAGWWALR